MKGRKIQLKQLVIEQMNSLYVFKQLQLKQGDYIYLMTEKGEGFYGSYENDYNNSNESFVFNNHSNGQTEVILIEKLQDLRKV